MLDVHILYTAGCASTPGTERRIRDVARDLGIAIRVARTEVTTQSQADRLCFLGSPTVQINGMDIDPAARASTASGFT